MRANNFLDYDPIEEKINAYSHGVGAVLAFIATILMIIKPLVQGDFIIM